MESINRSDTLHTSSQGMVLVLPPLRLRHYPSVSRKQIMLAHMHNDSSMRNSNNSKRITTTSNMIPGMIRMQEAPQFNLNISQARVRQVQPFNLHGSVAVLIAECS